MHSIHHTTLTLRTVLRRTGFGAVELVVGVALLGTILLYVLSTVSQFLKTGSLQVERTQALFLTQGTLEAERFMKQTNWTTYAALSPNATWYVAWGTSTVSATTTPQTEGRFTPSFMVSTAYRDAVTNDIVSAGGVADTGTRSTTARTTWTNGTTVLSAYLSDTSS